MKNSSSTQLTNFVSNNGSQSLYLQQQMNHTVERGLIIEKNNQWVWNTIYVWEFNTKEEAESKLNQLKQEPTGYCHYRIC